MAQSFEPVTVGVGADVDRLHGYLGGRELYKSWISRVIIGVTPFRVLTTLLTT